MHRLLLRTGSATLALWLLAGCGVPLAAPVDVEGTVQARVTATVGALNRTEATATRLPAGTAPAASAASPSAAGTAARTATSGTATAALQATASRAGGTTRPGAALTGTPRTGTPVAPTTSSGTPPATAIPAATAVGLGNAIRLGGVAVTVTHYQWGYECPSGNGKPPGGSKFVTLQITERNDGSGTLPAPPLVWTVANSGASTGSQSPCQPDEQALVNTCYRTAQLPPGERCEGWLIFEVPDSLDVPGSIVQARYAGGADIATWRIPPPS